MKGIILHAGHGTRLRPLTHTGPKQLLPIANKPMSQYALEDLRDAGVTDIAVVIGGTHSGRVREYYGDGEKFGVGITYVEQDSPRGIAHAVGLCRGFVGTDRFVVYLGDNILRAGLRPYVEKFEGSRTPRYCCAGWRTRRGSASPFWARTESRGWPKSRRIRRRTWPSSGCAF